MTCFNICLIVFCAVSSGVVVVVAEGTGCCTDIMVASKLPCPEGLRDDGANCVAENYARGAWRAPDKEPCPDGLRDDGNDCWSYPDEYAKRCCCSGWTNRRCCDNCKSGYHEEDCMCKRTEVKVVVNSSQRQPCRSDEDKYDALFYPGCEPGYHTAGCCICEPDGGPSIVSHLVKSCRGGEEHGAVLGDSNVRCYPKCRPGYRSVGCCICEPENSPMTLIDRLSCPDNFLKFLTLCLKINNCPLQDIIGQITAFGVNLIPAEIEQLKKLLIAHGKLID